MKKRLLVLLAVLLLLAVCTPGAFAYDVAAEQAENFGTASLESALPEQAYDAFGTLSIADAAQPQSLLAKLWAYVLREGGGAVASAARNAALLLAIVFLSALCASLSANGACVKVTQMAGTVAVAALSVTHVTSCITAGSEALATLRDFSKILLPSMCAAAAASGAATSAAAKYAATSLFLDVLLSAETAVLLPLLYLYAGTVICGTTLENDVLASLGGLLRKAFRLLLIGFASVFTLYLSLTGILTGSADAAAAKAVKTAVSAALPVVGSIVADAGMTVYTVSAVKRIPGFKNHVIVDGGMVDNPRYCLYRAKYTVLHAVDRGGETAVFDLAGRCCESGDILQPAVSLPADVKRGDRVAVCTTGAYNYSMASNYNRLGRPPIVMLRPGERFLAVRRETLEDLCALDI